jgi:ribonuclease P protein component
MLPRDERLTSAEFARVWERGKPLRHALLTARAVRREDEEPARCAFVVSRKSGKACVRNRLRRRVRECYRLGSARAKLKGNSVVFLINAARAEASPEEWTRAFDDLARRILREAAQPAAARVTGDGH